jgi:hypothetical protein
LLRDDKQNNYLLHSLHTLPKDKGVSREFAAGYSLNSKDLVNLAFQYFTNLHVASSFVFTTELQEFAIIVSTYFKGSDHYKLLHSFEAYIGFGIASSATNRILLDFERTADTGFLESFDSLSYMSSQVSFHLVRTLIQRFIKFLQEVFNHALN